MQRAYTIRAARADEVEVLPDIEAAAVARFADLPMRDAVFADSTSVDDFRVAQNEGLLWVAESTEGDVVGFALVEWCDGNAHLDELDVHPLHGRRGVGAALVRAVCEWARPQGLAAVTLTTYRDVPWNAPFYARLGFRSLSPGELSPRLADLVRHEAEHGLRAEDRVVMRFDVARP
jgi:GNAT superfamily N-acetyltransferase